MRDTLVSRPVIYLAALRIGIAVQFLAVLLLTVSSFAQEDREGIIVNGDKVEYSTTSREVTASGNVEVIYKGTRLTCDNLTVEMQSKDAVAEGKVRIEEKAGVIEGSRANYNFETKAGTIIDADFRSNPYYGKARQVDKLGDKQFISRRGYFTTCDLDKPHYRLKARKADFFRGERVVSDDIVAILGDVPMLYLPQYTHSLKDPLMHVQFSPGKTKDWGPYLLSAWRYNITDYIAGRIYLDYREKLGYAEGFGANYDTKFFGNGDFKFYYTQERSRHYEQGAPAEFQRFVIRLRHQWQIDDKTELVSQYYKIDDSKTHTVGGYMLKDYFPREYEKDLQPPFYIDTHRRYDNYSLDLLIQKRANRWYGPGYVEKLPELRFSYPSLQFAETPFYLENASSAGNYNRKNTSTSTPALNEDNPDAHFNRLDIYNKVSLPVKVAFLKVTPYVANRETFYSDGRYGSVSPRTVFYTGTDVSTKFYRVFDLHTDLLKLDINGLRHIITPNIGYGYNREPTVLSSKLRQVDGIDSISRSNSATLEISNKLQTKRSNRSVDIADFRVNSNYTFKPKAGTKRGSSLADITFDLELLPYAWLRVTGDATYKHSGSREDANYNTFSNANYDISFLFANERSFGFGQRYQRKGSDEFTYNLIWRFSPKWKFSLYHRLEIGHDYTLKQGLREQEYILSRDFHCWIVELNYNVKREKGESIWLVFRLKAFPEMDFGFNREYHQPKPGSQSPNELKG